MSSHSARSAPLIALLAANAISLVGNTLTWIAIPWFVLETTGSAAKTGLVGFFTVLPAILATFFGGTLVDRQGFKRMSIVADLLSGVTVAMVPLLYHTVGLAFWQLLLLVFLGALFDAPGGTARDSLLPDLVKLAGWRLERANALAEAVRRGAQLGGPLLAGLLIALLDASNVLWVDAATFAVSAALVAVVVPQPAKAAGQARGRYLDDVREGLRFIRGDRLVLALAITTALSASLDGPLFAVILPNYVKELYGGAEGLGLIVAAAGGGALIGLALFGLFGHRLPRYAILVVAGITFKLPWWVLAFSPPLPVATAAIVVSGIATGPIGPLWYTILQERIPAELRGRVFGVFGAAAMIGTPLMMIVTGYLVEWIGVIGALVVNNACYQAVGIAVLFSSSLREMNRPAPRLDAVGSAS
jgi:MFS family permease